MNRDLVKLEREVSEGKRVRLLIDTDAIGRVWRRCDVSSPHLAAASPFVEVGYLPADEFAELERNSVEDSSGWMVERR